MERRRLGELEQFVLLAVLRLGDDAWGAEIQRELRSRAKRNVSIGTIYVTLSRLEAKGMVMSWLGEPTAERGGKAKRHFRVERAGRAALRAARTAACGRAWTRRAERFDRRLRSEPAVLHPPDRAPDGAGVGAGFEQAVEAARRSWCDGEAVDEHAALTGSWRARVATRAAAC